MTEPVWLQFARKEIGVIEIPGKVSEHRILTYFAEAGHGEVRDDQVAWCAAFVGAMLHRAGVKGTGALNARGYENWGKTILQPALGCVGIKRRANGQPWQGHVGFVVAASPTLVWLLGGNQNDRVSIAPFSRWQFTGFRWPAAAPASDQPLPSALAAASSAVKEA